MQEEVLPRSAPVEAGPVASREARPAASGTATRRHLSLQTFSSLRHRDYRLLWAGSLFSSSGQWIQQVSIGWLTYQVTGSPFLLGAVNGFRALPLLLLGPFGGVAADRLDRKRLMLFNQLFLMTVTAVFATAVATGNAHIWNIILFTLLTGVAWAFMMPVRQSIVPKLVPREDLMNAIALNSAGINITRILGPSLAGLLIGLVGIAGNFYMQALAYVGVATMVWLMRVPPIAGASREVSVRHNLSEGIGYIWRHPTLRLQMSLPLIPVVLSMPYTSLMPVFAKDVLHVGPEGFGVMMAAPGIGALLGSLTIATLGNANRKGPLLFGSLLALGLALAAFSQSRSLPLSLALLVLVGGSQMTFMTTNHTLLQITTPDEFRGRVMGIYMLDQGLVPLGSLLIGTLADLSNAPFAVLTMGSAVFILSGLACLLMPALRKL